jgi:hypothetical protein
MIWRICISIIVLILSDPRKQKWFFRMWQQCGDIIKDVNICSPTFFQEIWNLHGYDLSYLFWKLVVCKEHVDNVITTENGPLAECLLDIKQWIGAVLCLCLRVFFFVRILQNPT